MALHAYLPPDRLRALIRGKALPEYCEGAALFVDIAGFTALTESLVHSRGPRDGVDELSRRINAVHSALIDAVDACSGSVVGLAGDGLTAWFDAHGGGPPPAARAVAAAAQMQRAMAPFADLSVKVGVASGPALRVAVGDPAIQSIDLLAGATVVRAVQAEALARAGEVLLDGPTALAIGPDAAAERRHSAGGEDFAVLDLEGAAAAALGLRSHPAPNAAPTPDTIVDPADHALLRPWLLPAVFERESAGGGLFATDLRPATAVFVRWPVLAEHAGVDGAVLRERVARAQRTVQAHGGVLLEVTADAVGCCLYANFGAVQAHEDDNPRALRAALALRDAAALAPHAVQIGLSRGTLYVGGYGGATRRSFGAIGDEVNSAARLMAQAATGEILVSGRVRQLAGDGFSFEPRPPMPIKGKAEPMPVFALTGLRRQRAIRLQEPAAVLPMVGRDAALAQVGQALAQARAGQGRQLRIVAEAGMGKSRLVAETVRLALRQGFIGYGASSGGGDGTHAPYRLWHGVWSAFFDLDPGLPQRRQRQAVQAALALHTPEHAEAWPLLGAVLAQDWPDTAFTATLAPRDRKALLETVLQRCLHAAAAEAAEDGVALLLVLEDVHDADPVSLELLALLARDVPALPLLLVTSERPAEGSATATATGQRAAADSALALAELIELTPLGPTEIEHIVRAKLAAWYPERAAAVPRQLIERIAARAQGNPFHVEELLDDLHDRGLDPRHGDAALALEWPSSLHSLVLSRLDRLAPAQQRELKAASVIGRAFGADELQGYCPALGTPQSVNADLDELARRGFTPRQPETAAGHVFKHLVTQEVSYENIVPEARLRLHAQYARYVEALAADDPGRQAPLLAHHFERAGDAAAAAHWLHRAGEQAAAAYANDEALACFERALRWLPADATEARFEIGIAREAVFHLQSRHAAQRAEQETLARLLAARSDAAGAAGAAEPVWAQRAAALALRRARMHIATGEYATALAEAGALASASALPATLQIEALLLQSRALMAMGKSRDAAAPLATARELARTQGLARCAADALSLTGLLHWHTADYEEAEAWLAEALGASRTLGDLRQQLDILNNIGMVAQARSRFGESVAHYAAAQAIAHRIGDRNGEAMLLNNQGSVLLAAGDFHAAGLICAQAAALFEANHEPVEHGMALINCAEAQREMGQYEAALVQQGRALALLRASGYKRGEALLLENIGLAELALGRLADAERSTRSALALAHECGMRPLAATLLLRLGVVQTAAGERAAARASLDAAAAALRSSGNGASTLEVDAALAAWALAGEDLPQAISHVERMLPLLQQGAAPGAAPLPMTVYASAWRVLQRAGRPEAHALREQARAELRQRSERIADAGARRDFLAIADHRLLLAD